MYIQIGKSKCSLCGAPGTNKLTCPLNPKAKKGGNPKKHFKEKKESSPSKMALNLEPFWVGIVPFPDVPKNDLVDEDNWSEHLDLLEKTYSPGLKNVVPKGTILFHGSDIYDPVNNIKKFRSNKAFFFGLDAYVSIWYAAESYYGKGKTAYLNIYKTTKEMKKVNYIGREIMDLNPGEVEECIKTDICIHPQFGYHSNDKVLEPPAELSVELTIPSHLVSKSNLEFIGTYKINLELLKKNEDLTYKEFKATDALLYPMI